MPAFRRFFEEWYPRLVRYLRARLGDADHAEDIAQEAFIRLLDHEPRDPAAWLFSVANNLVVDDARIASGRSRHLALIRADRAVSADASPEQPLIRAEEAARVRHALAVLPERDRILLVLHHDGLRYRDIARQLGVAPSSVGSLLTRAQRRFVRSFAALNGDETRHASL